jgi:hypothetical protein
MPIYVDIKYSSQEEGPFENIPEGFVCPIYLCACVQDSPTLDTDSQKPKSKKLKNKPIAKEQCSSAKKHILNEQNLANKAILEELDSALTTILEILDRRSKSIQEEPIHANIPPIFRKSRGIQNMAITKNQITPTIYEPDTNCKGKGRGRQVK